MKNIDKDGLLVCSIQGKVFSNSLTYFKCSSEIFMRRFMMSEIVKQFDSLSILDDTLTINNVYERLEEEFGKTNYGKVKYSSEVLYWIGYLYRYMAYTYDLSSKQVYKIIKPKELNELYYVYHTFDCSQAIERILEQKGISFDLDQQNLRLLKMLRKRKYEKEVQLLLGNAYSNYGLLKASEVEYIKANDKSLKNNVSKNDNILLEAYYNNVVVCEIKLNALEEEYELTISFKSEKYKNEEFLSVVIEQVLKYVKNILESKHIVAKIIKNEEKAINVFKSLGFAYKNEDDNYVYFLKKSK